MNKILILGKDGQVGRALLSQLGNDAIGLGRSECDFLDENFIKKLESHIHQPLHAVINAVAFTQVDKAETQHDQAFFINSEAVFELAAWCKKQNIPLVHFSTDYVFDGSGDQPRRETDATNPINVYGKSKRAGEIAIEEYGGKHLIFRTS